MAFGQFGVVVDPAKVDVACPDDECHVAPVFMGEGGFVGELADGFDMANFVVTCGNTTASGSVAPESDGVVRQAFDMANGLACHSEGGSIQIHGLTDGGWYWINDGMNAAVSPLIAKDALMGDEVMPTDPGGVTLTASDYGTYVKHSSGMVGILPHFVPTAPVEIPEIPEPEAATICMPVWDPEGGTPGEGTWVANAKNCMLGDGGTVIKMTMTANGSSSEVTSVHRDPDGGVVQVRLDLWGNGSGHVSSTTNPFLGWDVPRSQGRRPQPFDAWFVISPDREGVLGTSLADAGITLTRGGSMDVLPKKVPVPAAADGNKIDTPEREDGYTKDYNKDASAAMRAAARCTQDTDERSIGDAGKMATFILWAGTDGKEVAIQDTDEKGEFDDLPADDADLMDLEKWVTAFNSRTDGSKDIETVTVRDGSGESAVDRTIPAVICQMMDDPDHEPSKRYVSGTINISPETTYCDDDNNRSATVYVLAYAAASNPSYKNTVTPPIAQESYPNLRSDYWRQRLNASTALQVHCAE